MNDTSMLASLSGALAGLVEENAGRVVAVHGRQQGTASGIVLRPGVAVTAEETLERDDELELTLPNGATVPATLVGRDPSTDVAVLRFEGDVPVAAEPVPAAARAGAIVVAVGRNPAGPIAALGIVAHAGPAWRSSQGGEIDALIRADLALSGAGEGGALVDAAGGLIGMAVFGPRRRVIAIPTATLLRSAGRILAHGNVSRGYLGVGVQPVRSEDGSQAPMVVSVDPDGPAKHAGVLLGDILVSWNGEAIAGARGIVDRLGPDSVGAAVELGILRAGARASASVTIGGRKAG